MNLIKDILSKVLAGENSDSHSFSFNLKDLSNVAHIAFVTLVGVGGAAAIAVIDGHNWGFFDTAVSGVLAVASSALAQWYSTNKPKEEK